MTQAENNVILASKPTEVFSLLRSHPQVSQFVRELWVHNFDNYGFGWLAEKLFEETIASLDDFETSAARFKEILKEPSFKKMLRKQWKEPKMALSYRMLEPFMNDTRSFLDFGCGRLALLRKIGQMSSDELILYGFDPYSDPEHLPHDPRIHFFTSQEALSKLKDIDMAYTSYVFHHLEEHIIHQSLDTLHKLLKPGGTLLVIEETFPEINSVEQDEEAFAFAKASGIDLEKNLREKFLELPTQEKLLTLFVNDVLININNLGYMPWTNQYRSMNQWTEVISSHGFNLQQQLYFGVFREGRLKQGITSLLRFRKDP